MITTTNLKNAARAIECDLWTDTSGANYLVKDGAILRRWEPLEDDGDALRLAVSLKIDIKMVYGGARCSGYCRELLSVDINDWMVGVRSAIVRAAADIGEHL